MRFVTLDVRRARIMHLEVRRAGDVLSGSRQKAVAGFTNMIESSLKGSRRSYPPSSTCWPWR